MTKIISLGTYRATGIIEEVEKPKKVKKPSRVSALAIAQEAPSRMALTKTERAELKRFQEQNEGWLNEDPSDETRKVLKERIAKARRDLKAANLP